MRLAGDIGGTKTTLSLQTRDVEGLLTPLKEHTYSSQDFRTFDDILQDFLPANIVIESACFGVAGPIVNQQCRTTNLPWFLDADDLKKLISVDKIKLLNDLEAMAIGMLYLPEADLLQLNPNAEERKGHIAVIAAGTGLGEALLYWDGSKHHPIGTEGGHTDLAAQNEQQDRLLAYLRKIYPDHVSCERVISGIGFSHLYDFLCHDGFATPTEEVPKCSTKEIDRNAVISKLGMSGEDALCREAVRLFVELYGAEAGNLVLKSLATGGVFIGGGIAQKILPAMQNGLFMQAFKTKGRFFNLLDKISVKVALNPRTPLIGAINYFAS